MAATLTANEEAQILETIQMFEVITQADPSDHVSLEILKEAYFKLGQHDQVTSTAKRIAKAYVHSGELSQAILEYESILQLVPDDAEAAKALLEIESKSGAFSAPSPTSDTEIAAKSDLAAAKDKFGNATVDPATEDEGRQAMFKLFVEGKHLSAPDFDLSWNAPASANEASRQLVEPFIQRLAEKQILPLEKSLKLICDKARLSFLPLDRYDVDVELARGFSREACLRWCVLPFDRMSKSVLVATANPFNKKVERELARTQSDTVPRQRFIWYVASPTELLKILRKTFR